MAPLTVATWNINSVRLRVDQAVKFCAMADVDVLCLQEIKCKAQQFPKGPFKEAGYDHFKMAGQNGMHGVAFVSRVPIEVAPEPDFCRHGHARVATGIVRGVEFHCYYVPAGGDVPDPDVNAKFAHKLDFTARMAAHFGAERARLDAQPIIITGDLNIAPGEHDVWSHKQLLDVVCHTPVEVDALNAIKTAGGFTDVSRALVPEPEPVFTWWSYRAKDWRKSNRGRRLDHIWVSSPLAGQVAKSAPDTHKVWDDVRDWPQPSDHAPVTWRFEA